MDILFDAFREMISEDGAFLMTRRYSDFNASLQFFLPKKPIDEVDGVAIYEPSGVRPLNVTNTDNRLIASAVRTAVEPVLGPLITTDQKGFIGGRSMASNVIDVDEAMTHASLEQERAVAIFYDFAAAFPSSEHVFFVYVLRFSWLAILVVYHYPDSLCFKLL